RQESTAMHDRKGMQRAIAGVLISACAAAQGATSARLERGELLYNTHCLACHTEQRHWREQRLVTDLDSLALQVRRWQAVARARWSDEDIEAVVRYLNDAFYHFLPPRQGN
ncbi:MAG TPA: hypothetical protein VGE12_22210, partial [Noviherbaspirillum sp.]